MKRDTLFEAIARGAQEGLSNEELTNSITSRFGVECAVLVLDSVGFTRIVKRRGLIFFLALIASLREKGREIFEECRALRWRAEADNLYGEFATVDDAVRAAFALHAFYDEQPIELTSPEDLFGVCIGIGWGRFLKSDHEGLYGDEMNIASKLGEDMASRGETLLTGAAFEQLTLAVSADAMVMSASSVEQRCWSITPGP